MFEAVQTFRMYICMYVSYTSVDENEACMYVCIYVRTYVCMYEAVSSATVDQSEAEHVCTERFPRPLSIKVRPDMYANLS